MCSSWFTYLPTYLLTNLPANLRVQSPRPVHRGTILFVCVLLLAISSPPSLFHSRHHLLLPLLGWSTFLSFPLLTDHLFLPCSVSPSPCSPPLGDRDHAARSPVSLPSPFGRARRSFTHRHTRLTHHRALSLLSSLRLLYRLASSRLASPHRATPRHGSPRSRLDLLTARSESRLTNLLESAR